MLDNDRRWNSTYMIVQKALEKQTNIRAFIFTVIGELDATKRMPSDNILSNED